MAITRFESTDFTNKKISELSNTPNLNGMSATDLKARFDAMTQQAVDLLNTRLIDVLNSTTDGSSGADNVSATTIDGIVGTTVQAIMENVALLAQGHTTDINGLVKSVTYNPTNGVFTITKFDDSSTTIDTPLEKVVTNFRYDQATESLILTYPDGTTVSISLASFISEYDFLDSASIKFTVSNHKVTANLDQTYYNILEGFKDSASASATNASTYASDALGYSNTASQKATEASNSATSASNSATSASGSATSSNANKLVAEGYAVGKQNGEDVSSSSPYYHNNAKWYSEQAHPGSSMLKGVYDTHNKNADIFDYADSGVSTHDSSNSAHSTLFNSKQNTLVSGINIKTINGSAILGSGNIELSSSVASIVVSGAGNEALVTATNGTTTYTIIADENGKAIINVSEFGTYTISSSAVSGKTVSVVVDTIGTHKVAFTTLYCVRITRNTSSPSDRCTYLEDNADYESAYMNYSTGVFNYGSWTDAFFMPKPCMLKYDGTVDYYLNPNNYAQKLDGTASDIANTSYGGNVMIQFPTIWTKHTTDGTYDYIYVSDSKIDNNFECYSHRDKNGNVIPYCYMPAYCGSLISSKIRSISGQGCMNSQTGTNEITYARANNPSGFDIWDTEVLADRILIQDLLVLMGKSTNTQAVFGNGHYTGGSSASSLLQSGTMNSRGLFWGTNGTGNGVKVFGIENFWGNQWRRIRGWINANGTQKIKLTKGTYDGSTASDYNTDGNGYIAVSGATPSGTSGGYISTMVCTSYGRIPSVASGSETTYECDGLWFNNSQVDYAGVGGGCGVGFRVGAFSSLLSDAVSNSSWHLGASLSCKPIV